MRRPWRSRKCFLEEQELMGALRRDASQRDARCLTWPNIWSDELSRE